MTKRNWEDLTMEEKLGLLRKDIEDLSDKHNNLSRAFIELLKKEVRSLKK
jgi:hypothetical protein